MVPTGGKDRTMTQEEGGNHNSNEMPWLRRCTMIRDT